MLKNNKILVLYNVKNYYEINITENIIIKIIKLL